MPKNTDLDLDDATDSSTAGDSSTGESGKKSAETVDYESKYRGQSRVVTRLNNQLSDLRQKLDDLTADYEDKLSKLTGDTSTSTKRIKELESLLDAANGKVSKLEQDATRSKTRLEKAADISSKYPALSEPFLRGDLKDVSDFEKPEDFDAYMDRMSKLLGSTSSAQPEPEPESDRRRGATPPSGGSTRHKGDKPMTAMEIRDRLMKLDPFNDKHKDEYESLMEQLDYAD